MTQLIAKRGVSELQIDELNRRVETSRDRVAVEAALADVLNHEQR